jgi:hypothetical protein
VVEEVDMRSCNEHAYGVPGRKSVTEQKRLRGSDAVFAGQGKPRKTKSGPPTSLSGEVWNGSSDPQKSTLAQRAWMYVRERSQRASEASARAK